MDDIYTFAGQFGQSLDEMKEMLTDNRIWQERLVDLGVVTAQEAVCVLCFLPIHSGHKVRWTYQPGSHRRKVPQDFSSTFFLRCVP